MSELVVSELKEEAPEPSSLNVNDIFFILFRHKWKILMCATAGILAAAGIYFFLSPVYVSEGKLLVRYVVDKSAIDGLDSQIKTPNPQTDTIINSEVEILLSTDLAREIAIAVGVDRLVPQGGAKATIENATQAIFRGLDISVLKGTNIITVTFKSNNPKLPLPVLQELIKRYFDKHLEIHRSAGAFDFVMKEAAELKNQLNQTDAELKDLKAKAGVISLTETRTTLATELAKTQEEWDTTEGELTSQVALVKDLEKSLSVTESSQSDGNQSDSAPRPVSGDITQKYQSVVSRLTQLQQAETELLSKYTAENRLVKIKADQIAGLEKQRRDMEKKYPALIDSVVATTSTLQPTQGTGRPSLMAERARLAGLQSRADTLRARVAGLKQRADLIAELGPRIEELERKKEVIDTNYKHSESSLEKARIDETLDPSRIPNISVVQTPLAATKSKRNVKNLVIGLAVGGLGIGVAIALLIELVLDRTVKRSLEFESRLRLPLLLSIPHLGYSGERLRLHDAGHDSDDALEIGPGYNGVETSPGELLRPFCEAIRDRLGLYFENTRMTHKPKLVAVTGLSRNAGASTLAAGLADALSESGDGKVLLVDKPVAPKRFYDMLMKFKESDLDYVVFDMPSLGATSATVPMSGFMDKVLLVVEAEKSNRDAVKQAYAQLAAKVDVSVIFNKSRSYGPKWLEGEL